MLGCVFTFRDSSDRSMVARAVTAVRPYLNSIWDSAVWCTREECRSLCSAPAQSNNYLQAIINIHSLK
jgi:hypothetical protein